MRQIILLFYLYTNNIINIIIIPNTEYIFKLFVGNTKEKYTNKIDNLYYKMSWIEREEKILQIQQNYLREPMDTIRCYFLYINLNSYIEKITSEQITILYQNGEPSNGQNTSKIGIIPKEQVLHIIQQKRLCNNNSTNNNTKYVFKDSWMYLVDLEPENLQNYSKSENFQEISKQFFQVLPPIEDIRIPPSIFIFHDINALYFLFQEVPPKENVQPKSILKITDSIHPELGVVQNKKKKVTIKLHNDHKNAKKTRRNLHEN